ncbi:MAG: mraY [Candidatus Midichloriaceae bacterium]|nr:mraY [Candidatus Midichloriaceae bacterium]
MLYHILTSYIPEVPSFNIFKYITFRSALAMITALLVSFMLGERLISFLKNLQDEGQPIREDGPKSHLNKKGTPTMGGLMIIFSVLIATLIWSDLTNPFVLVTLFVFISFGFIGFIDDYKKLRYKNSKGVPGRIKLLWQFIISFIATYVITFNTAPEISHSLSVPFFKNVNIHLGLFYFIFAAIVITGSSNAVNLTDGLDGLAIGPVVIASACFALICYLTGNAIFSDYLRIPNIIGVGEISVFCCAIIGAGLGFLWYNAPPAQIFMGDVGSLAIGSALGVVSVLCKHEVVLAIIGGLFVIEALSVMIQVFCFKMWGYRPFKMAPIHHHFESLGWSETKVVIRFWILAIIFALIGLATLKLR